MGMVEFLGMIEASHFSFKQVIVVILEIMWHSLKHWKGIYL